MIVWLQAIIMALQRVVIACRYMREHVNVAVLSVCMAAVKLAYLQQLYLVGCTHRGKSTSLSFCLSCTGFCAGSMAGNFIFLGCMAAGRGCCADLLLLSPRWLALLSLLSNRPLSRLPNDCANNGSFCGII